MLENTGTLRCYKIRRPFDVTKYGNPPMLQNMGTLQCYKIRGPPDYANETLKNARRENGSHPYLTQNACRTT